MGVECASDNVKHTKKLRILWVKTYPNGGYYHKPIYLNIRERYGLWTFQEILFTRIYNTIAGYALMAGGHQPKKQCNAFVSIHAS